MENIIDLIKRLKLKILGFGKGELYYINSPQLLPPPLSKEEEQAIIDRLQQGDIKSRDKLVEHNLRLVVYIAKKFENSGVNIEDLISIGTIGLIKAVNTFKADKNIKLATYASRCIENEILMYLRKINQQKLDISLDEPLNVDWDGNELLLSDVLGSDGLEINDNVEQEDEKRILHTCMQDLSDRERLIMNMRFGLDGKKEHTQKEVADILGISQSYISRLEKRIILKLKRDIERQTVEK
ncbi:MAG: RNA polymerase sporulation sigma factor SigE [Ruminococcaceae bacterium]|nr:RNA polymerase sporulation sigma factor SigE [Oscillospiraceae bacterium]